MKRLWRGGHTPYVLWSGGIDSTALIGLMIEAGIPAQVISVPFYSISAPRMAAREARARERIWAEIQRALPAQRRLLYNYMAYDGLDLSAFTAKGEIPRRNRYLIDYVITRCCGPAGTIGMGEYVGADTWVVQDHVAAADADTRALVAYLWHEWGPAYRLLTLSDFGRPARFKKDRLELGLSTMGRKIMGLTTNCLADSAVHCGLCYKCVERAVAWHLLGKRDPTRYLKPPRKSHLWPQYLAQQQGSELR